MTKINYKIWLLPLLFFQVYLSLTLIVFFGGPWPWPVQDPFFLLFYLVLSQVSISIGYLFAWRNKPPNIHDPNFRHIAKNVTFLKYGLLVTFLLFIPTSLSRTGNIIPDIVFGIQNQGLAYSINFERLNLGNPFLLAEYLRMAFSIYLAAVFPLCVVYWSKLNGWFKAASLIAVLANISTYIATGTNKGVADFVITLPWLIFLGSRIGTVRLLFGYKALIPVFAAFLVLFLIAFGAGQSEREGGVGKYGIFNTGVEIIKADPTNFVSKFLDDDTRIIYQSLTLYVTQGYYALSLGFEVDNTSTFGLGNSMFLARQANSTFNTDFFTQNSVPGLIEEKFGWGMYSLWHSIYPWIASDVGFTGTLFVMMGLGYLLGRSWLNCLLQTDPLWLVMFNFMLIIFYYIPANNQLFQGGETVIGFWVTLFLLFFKSLKLPIDSKLTSIKLPSPTIDKRDISA